MSREELDMNLPSWIETPATTLKYRSIPQALDDIIFYFNKVDVVIHS